MDNMVSIVVPIYNVENYLGRCLESIINQTYKNLEIICVNDGSTDKSGQICDNYAKKDNRVKVIHRDNGGVSSARNTGLNIAAGDFIGFVDPDDWIEPEMYELLISSFTDDEIDISIVNYFIDTDNVSVPMTNELEVVDIPFNQEYLFKYAFMRDEYKGFGGYIWNKLFRSSLLISDKKNRTIFDESIQFCEDILFFTHMGLNSRKSVYINKPMYHYFKRKSSLSQTTDIKKREGSLHSYGKIIELLYGKDIATWLKRFYTYHASLLLEICLENNNENNNENKILYYKNETNRYIDEYIMTNLNYPDRIERINKLLI